MTMHAITLRTTHKTAACVLALWATSFGLSYLHLGAFALPVALLIAIVKAVLVGLFFMELATERFSVRVTLLAGVAMMVTLIALVLADYATRSMVDLKDLPRVP